MIDIMSDFQNKTCSKNNFIVGPCSIESYDHIRLAASSAKNLVTTILEEAPINQEHLLLLFKALACKEFVTCMRFVRIWLTIGQ